MENNTQLDQQTAFNKVWQHFVVEKHGPSFKIIEGDYYCQYRGPNGERCAVGVLLPDSEYSPNMEDSIPYPPLTYDVGFDEWQKVDSLRSLGPYFLGELQGCHDGAVVSDGDAYNFLVRVEAKLVQLADEYELTVPTGSN